MSETNRRPLRFPPSPELDRALHDDLILCAVPNCPNLRRADGTALCEKHRAAFLLENERRRQEAELTRRGICKGCGNAIGAPNPDRDSRYCLRCWEEAEALHDEDLLRQARERVRNAQARRDRQAAEAILRDIEALGPMRWWETPRAVVWGYAVAALLVAVFVWRVVG